MHDGQNPIHVFVHDNPFFKPLIVFLCGAILSLINSRDLAAATTIIGKYVFLFGFWLPAGIHVLDSLRRFHWMLIVLVAAALVPLIPGISDFFFDSKMTVVIDRFLEMNLIFTTPQGGRFGSTMGHPNAFGLMLVVVFPISLWLICFTQTKRAKFFGFLFLCMLLTGSVVTASRSAAVALFIQALVFIAFLPRRTIKLRSAYFLSLIVLTTAVLTIAIKAKPVIVVDRFVEMASYELGEYIPDSERIDFMIEAWEAICTHPIAGIGVDHTGGNEESIAVHNTILRLWAGIGIWGLFFSCWIYFIAFTKAFMNIKKALQLDSTYFSSISLLLLVSLIGWFFMDMVQPMYYNRIKFVTLILLLSLSKLINTDNISNSLPKLKPFQNNYAG